MKKYNIIFSPDADNDLADIVLYLGGFSPNIALKYYDEITAKAYTLETMPFRCSLVRDESLAEKGVRRISAKNYDIYFTVDEGENTVYIERILYSSMAFDVLL